MLDEDEFDAIYRLYGECFRSAKVKRNVPAGRLRPTLDDVFEPVRKEYERMTGMAD